ncbi:aromatic acid exporter family protein [Oceanobacillus sp. CAU 1775]
MKKIIGGSRIIKTGVAILLTAWICELFGWPPVFAVITAIVTIEPTVSDSIKKGIVRFPASAIGSAYAVLFISFFGNSPITYTLAAVLTIATCFRLNLHAGLLVATLTSVAMVEVIHDNYFLAFLIRLGTTTIGLVVSTIVNMFVLPPDYREDITTNIDKIKKHTATALDKISSDILTADSGNKAQRYTMLAKLKKEITNTNTLIRFQKDESKYHPLVTSEEKLFQLIEKQAEILRRIHDDLDDLLRQPTEGLSWSEKDKEIIRSAVMALTASLKSTRDYDHQTHQLNKQKITEIFWRYNSTITETNEQTSPSLPPELIVLYELLSIYGLVEEFYEE